MFKGVNFQRCLAQISVRSMFLLRLRLPVSQGILRRLLIFVLRQEVVENVEDVGSVGSLKTITYTAGAQDISSQSWPMWSSPMRCMSVCSRGATCKKWNSGPGPPETKARRVFADKDGTKHCRITHITQTQKSRVRPLLRFPCPKVFENEKTCCFEVPK